MNDTNARLEFRLPESMKQAFLEAAQKDDQDAAKLLRKFIREYLKNHALNSLISRAKTKRRKG